MEYREVLILHPQTSVRELLEAFLHSEFEDLLVVGATTGAEAEALIEEQRFDLILCASRLADQAGVQLYVTAKKSRLNCATPLVMLVDPESKDQTSVLYQHGIEHILNLPTNPELLQRKVRQLTNPRDKRKAARYSHPGIIARVYGKGCDCPGEVINLSGGSVLCELRCKGLLSLLMQATSLDLQFPADLKVEKLSKLPCRLSRLWVLEWNDEGHPTVLRVAWSFQNLEGAQARHLDQALGQIDSVYQPNGFLG